jgi:hypothetical protein
MLELYILPGAAFVKNIISPPKPIDNGLWVKYDRICLLSFLEKKAEEIAKRMEYTWNNNKADDIFAMEA